VEDNPMQFRFQRTLKDPGIFSYPVDADIYFRVYWLIWFGEGECDNIGIEIMLKKLAVYFEQSIVGAKNILEISQFFALFFKQPGQESLQRTPLLQGNFLEKMKLYRRISSRHFQKS
jgi:hypothetical protein